jgi:hypothetical protein
MIDERFSELETENAAVKFIGNLKMFPKKLYN